MTIREQLFRVSAASRAWDDAADALSRRDRAGFDNAMIRFRQFSIPREAGGEPKAVRNNP